MLGEKIDLGPEFQFIQPNNGNLQILDADIMVDKEEDFDESGIDESVKPSAA